MTPFRSFTELVRHELHLALRTRRVWVLIGLYVTSALVAAYATAAAIDRAQTMIAESVSEATGVTEDAARAVIDDNKDRALDGVLELLKVDPATISKPLRRDGLSALYFLGSLWFAPWLVLLAMFDTMSTDLAGRTLCYTTMRAPRGFIVAARWLANVVLVALVSTTSAIVVFGVGAAKLGSFDVAAAGLSAARAIVALIPYSAAYVALALACSAATKRPLLSLLLALATMLVLRLVAWWSDAPEHPLWALHWLSPSTYRAGLWRGDVAGFAAAVAAFAGFAAAGVAAAHYLVGRRDL